MDGQKQIALVTGASSGIGADFARVMAQRGADIILTARRAERLEDLRGELEAEHAIRVTVLPADLSTADGATKLFERTEALGLPVDVLINNAGFGLFGPFLQQTASEIAATIDVNVTALTTLTRLYAERMAARRSGHILQVSSYAGLQPIPRYTVYSGAKAYVVAFSQALRYELRRHNVHVSVIAPGFASTEFHAVAGHEKTRAMRFLSLPPRAIAEAGVRGMYRKRFLITPGLWYRLNNLVLPFLPRGLAAAISAAVVKNRSAPRQNEQSRNAA